MPVFYFVLVFGFAVMSRKTLKIITHAFFIYSYCPIFAYSLYTLMVLFNLGRSNFGIDCELQFNLNFAQIINLLSWQH